jgi:hypothetical protein
MRYSSFDMHVSDVLAVLLLVGAAVAFAFGSAALARAEDLRALYWLAVGIISVRAAVHMARPGREGAR